MEIGESRFLDTVLNSPEQMKQFLIDNGIEGKSTAPIYFFSEDERDKFLRREWSSDVS